MGDTSISWTHRPGTRGRVWNPTQGCSRISSGCERCYAERMAARFTEDGWSKGLINIKTRRWNGEVRIAEHKLADPLRWREPSTVFVNSMSDLFHEKFTNEEIAAVFGVMAACPQHTFQVLTKRAKRMREWFEWMEQESSLARDAAVVHYEDTRDMEVRICLAHLERYSVDRKHVDYPKWPLPWVWLGVSVENQDAADERIPELLRSPAAVRFLSCEPLIGPIRLHEWLCREHGLRQIGAPAGLHWIIAGCESGPGARPCDIEWIRSLRDQCASAGVKYFLKQAGDWRAPLSQRNGIMTAGDGSKCKPGGVIELPYLDGFQHAAFPEVIHG